MTNPAPSDPIVSFLKASKKPVTLENYLDVAYRDLGMRRFRILFKTFCGVVPLILPFFRPFQVLRNAHGQLADDRVSRPRGQPLSSKRQVPSASRFDQAKLVTVVALSQLILPG